MGLRCHHVKLNLGQALLLAGIAKAAQAVRNCRIYLKTL